MAVRKSKKTVAGASPLILTIGHSTHPIEQFIALLKAHEVTRIIDVRTVPRSRHNPQFNKTTLPKSLKKADIAYAHMAGLGGLRHTSPDSPNTGWRNASFRGYADYMQTPQFKASLADLIEIATHDRVALMCAEAVPWRCHRSLIADALLLHNIEVRDIMTVKRASTHKLTPFAKVRAGKITYPPEKGKKADISKPS